MSFAYRKKLLHRSKSTPALRSNCNLTLPENSNPLRVLICSSNVGNREPSTESIAALIPENGHVGSVLNETKYQVGLETDFPHFQVSGTVKRKSFNQKFFQSFDSALKARDQQKNLAFDLIVIGMQEATFNRSQRASLNSGEYSNCDFMSQKKPSVTDKRKRNISPHDFSVPYQAKPDRNPERRKEPDFENENESENEHKNEHEYKNENKPESEHENKHENEHEPKPDSESDSESDCESEQESEKELGPQINSESKLEHVELSDQGAELDTNLDSAKKSIFQDDLRIAGIHQKIEDAVNEQMNSISPVVSIKDCKLVESSSTCGSIEEKKWDSIYQEVNSSVLQTREIAIEKDSLSKEDQIHPNPNSDVVGIDNHFTFELFRKFEDVVNEKINLSKRSASTGHLVDKKKMSYSVFYPIEDNEYIPVSQKLTDKEASKEKAYRRKKNDVIMNRFKEYPRAASAPNLSYHDSNKNMVPKKLNSVLKCSTKGLRTTTPASTQKQVYFSDQHGERLKIDQSQTQSNLRNKVSVSKKRVSFSVEDDDEKINLNTSEKLLKRTMPIKSTSSSTPLKISFTKKGDDKNDKKPSRIKTAKLSVRSATNSENFISQKKGEFVSHAEFSGKDTKILHRSIAERCPNHVFVVNYLHGGIRLMILVDKKLVKEVEDITCKAVSTGIGRLKNKGGIVASMQIRKTRLAFISAHLAAHEGYNYYLRRNQDIASILDGGKMGKYDTSIENHHCFVFGDLNYRINFPTKFDDCQVKTQKVVELIQRQDWNTLNKLDELQEGLKNKEMMVGFKTPLCLFPPTFKVQREPGFNYLSKRTPSFTDRIVWRSSEHMERNVTPLVYEPIENFTTSDHKPIRGVFNVVTNAPKSSLIEIIGGKTSLAFSCLKTKWFRRRKRTSRDSKRATPLFSFPKDSTFTSIFKNFGHTQVAQKTFVYITNFKCYRLTKKNHTSYYVMCDANSKKLLSYAENEKGVVSDRRCLSSTCQKFKEITNEDNNEILNWCQEEIPIQVSGDSSLKGALLYLNLMGKTLLSKQDNLIGTVALNLDVMCKFERDGTPNIKMLHIDQPFLKCGRIQGYLQCTLHVFSSLNENHI